MRPPPPGHPRDGRAHLGYAARCAGPRSLGAIESTTGLAASGGGCITAEQSTGRPDQARGDALRWRSPGGIAALLVVVVVAVAFGVGLVTGNGPSPGATSSASSSNGNSAGGGSPSAGTPLPVASGVASATATSGPTAIQHVFLVVLENTYYSTAFRRTYAHGLATANAYATAYHATGHPSLGNYLNMTGGTTGATSGDCSPGSGCHVAAPNVVDRLEAAGFTWKAYFESMGTACKQADSGAYVAHHDPFIYFDSIRTDPARCASHVVDAAHLATDLASVATTPNFVFVAPNDDNNDGAAADTWLSTHLPAMLSSKACTQESCLVVVTWDEDDYKHDNRVLTIFAGSGARPGGSASDKSYTHFSLLRTVESIFGLAPLTSKDAAASPMADMLR